MYPKAAFLALLALIVVACAAPDTAEPTGSASASPTATASGSASEQPSGTPTATAPTPTPTPVAGGDLPVPGFAMVTADRIFIRQEPSTDGEPLLNADFCIDNPDPDCARPFMLGTDSGYVQLYVFDGPVEADGYTWYLAATEMHTEERASVYPEAVGWVASGDAEDAWLVADTRTCPDQPVELAEITSLVMTRLERLDCFGSEPLTVRGWYPDLPPGESEPEPTDLEACRAENGWPACGSLFDLLRPDEGEWAGDADYLDFVIDPAAGITMPGRSQWVEVTGSFDHPASTECVGVAGVLNCRANFVVTSVRVP